PPGPGARVVGELGPPRRARPPRGAGRDRAAAERARLHLNPRYPVARLAVDFARDFAWVVFAFARPVVFFAAALAFVARCFAPDCVLARVLVAVAFVFPLARWATDFTVPLAFSR